MMSLLLYLPIYMATGTINFKCMIFTTFFQNLYFDLDVVIYDELKNIKKEFYFIR